MVAAEEDVKLCIIDVRLGKQEDNAEDQVLGAWSANQDREPAALMDIARLARGSIGLCSHFSKEALCTSVSFEAHALVVVEAEPALFWIIYVPSFNGSSFPLCTEWSMSCLKSMSKLFGLMYRSLSRVIDGQGYLAARGALKDFLNAFMPGFCKQEGWCTLHDLYTPMTEHRGVPFIPLKDPCFQGLQAMGAALAATNLVQERPTLGCMITYKQALLHTTLSGEDAAALYLFASRNVIPLTRTENKTTRTFQRLYSGVTDWRKRTGAILEPASWSSASTPEHQGFLFCEQCGTQLEAGALSTCGGCPELYLACGEPARLVVWQQQGFMVLLAVAGEQHIHIAEFDLVRAQLVRLLTDVERQLAPLLASPRQGLINAIATEVRGHEKGHVQGHRYTLIDNASEVPICASTPTNKLQSATSQSCQAALGLAWQDCQLHMAADATRWPQPVSQSWGLPDIVVSPELPDNAGSRGEAPGAGCSHSTGREPEDSSAGQECCQESNEVASHQRLKRMEMLAQAPNGKWVQARWSLCSELLHIDDTSSKDNNSLASANRNVQSMLSTYFPGVLGL